MRVYSKRLISGEFIYSNTPENANGWKYTMLTGMDVQTDIIPSQEYHEQFFSLFMNGMLRFKTGYSWDGASGGCPDHDSIMFGSCVHDACCQLFHMGIISKAGRIKADDLLYEIVRCEMLVRANGYFWKRIWANNWSRLVWIAVRGYTFTQ